MLLWGALRQLISSLNLSFSFFKRLEKGSERISSDKQNVREEVHVTVYIYLLHHQLPSHEAGAGTPTLHCIPSLPVAARGPKSLLLQTEDQDGESDGHPSQCCPRA